MRDILRRKYKIYTPAFDCALRHIRLHSCVKLLRDGNPAHFSYATQCRCPIAIIARDNDSDQFAVPVAGEGTQKNRNHVGPSPGVNSNAAGIDVGNAEHYVAVPAGRDAEPLQTFGSFTADLHRMAQWLKACGIETVVMQATGVYWIALFQILEGYGFQVNVIVLDTGWIRPGIDS